tara:strand:- start:2130 stop:2837 length:708 start_codon:yes stop_codon:yes gene_type:complete
MSEIRHLMKMMAQNQAYSEKRRARISKALQEDVAKSNRTTAIISTAMAAVSAASDAAAEKSATTEAAKKEGFEVTKVPKTTKTGRQRLFGKDIRYTKTDRFGNTISLTGAQFNAVQDATLAHGKTFNEVLLNKSGAVKKVYSGDNYISGKPNYLKNLGRLKPSETKSNLESAGFDQDMLDDIFGTGSSDTTAMNPAAKLWDWFKTQGIKLVDKSGLESADDGEREFFKFLKQGGK